MKKKKEQVPDPGSALRRELISILFMYAALAVLPFLTGFACSGSL